MAREPFTGVPIRMGVMGSAGGEFGRVLAESCHELDRAIAVSGYGCSPEPAPAFHMRSSSPQRAPEATSWGYLRRSPSGNTSRRARSSGAVQLWTAPSPLVVGGLLAQFKTREESNMRIHKTVPALVAG